jgi:hypothetical protein
MKHLGSVALLSVLSTLSLVGCENGSRLDKTVKSIDKAEPTAEKAPPAAKADRSGSLEDRVARLEDNYARHAEALDFLGKVYEQQKAQQRAQQERDPDPDAVFAVDVAPNVKAGLVEGPQTALVTIVEAWDFA